MFGGEEQIVALFGEGGQFEMRGKAVRRRGWRASVQRAMPAASGPSILLEGLFRGGASMVSAERRRRSKMRRAWACSLWFRSRGRRIRATTGCRRDRARWPGGTGRGPASRSPILR